jgi:hypothetical protein
MQPTQKSQYLISAYTNLNKTFSDQTFPPRDLRFLQKVLWKFQSSGMWKRVCRYIGTIIYKTKSCCLSSGNTTRLHIWEDWRHQNISSCQYCSPALKYIYLLRFKHNPFIFHLHLYIKSDVTSQHKTQRRKSASNFPLTKVEVAYVCVSSER